MGDEVVLQLVVVFRVDVFLIEVEVVFFADELVLQELLVVLTVLLLDVLTGVEDVLQDVVFGQLYPTHLVLVVLTDLDVDDEVGGEVEVELVEEEDKMGRSQGCVDSRFFATYKERWSGPPQNCVLLPVHAVEHALASVAAVPLPSTTPQ